MAPMQWPAPSTSSSTHISPGSRLTPATVHPHMVMAARPRCLWPGVAPFADNRGHIIASVNWLHSQAADAANRPWRVRIVRSSILLGHHGHAVTDQSSDPNCLQRHRALFRLWWGDHQRPADNGHTGDQLWPRRRAAAVHLRRTAHQQFPGRRLPETRCMTRTM